MKMRWCLTFLPLVAPVLASFEQDDFVTKMNAAMTEQKRDSRLTARLMEMATPFVDENSPRFLQDYQNFAINITDYALRYIGCQNVHQYSDEMAQDEDSTTVLGMNRFVIVRLCPKDACSNYHQYGCSYGFGDYLIPMEDYLETMAEEYFLEYQNYCETCYACELKRQQNQQQKNQQQQQEDDAAAQNDDAAQNNNAWDDAMDDDAVGGDDGNANNARRRLADDDAYYYKGADFYNNMDDGNQDECDNYYYACMNYQSACKDYSQYATDMESFFQCSEFNIGNESGYIGPHCRSDGTTIGLGLYKDQYCNEYGNDLTDLSSMLGMDLDDGNLKAYYSRQCITCNATESITLGAADGDEVTPICAALYDMSAKCNKYMGSDGDYEHENQEENEELACTFIHNLITNNYDEYGHVYLQSEGWQSYVPDVRTMSKFQKYALSISVLLVVGLFSYALYLHRAIQHSRNKERRLFGWPGETVQIERMHSGIIQGRSRSEIDPGAVYA